MCRESLFADSSTLCSRPSPIVKRFRRRRLFERSEVLTMNCRRNMLTRSRARLGGRVFPCGPIQGASRANQQNMGLMAECFARSCGRTKRDSTGVADSGRIRSSPVRKLAKSRVVLPALCQPDTVFAEIGRKGLSRLAARRQSPHMTLSSIFRPSVEGACSILPICA